MPATLERTTDAPSAAPGPAREPDRERPVFASETRRRARVLRILGWTLAGLTALWLVALVLGAFGLRPLPAIGLPQAPGASEGRDPSATKARAAGGGEVAGARKNEDGAASAAAAASRGGDSAGDASEPSTRGVTLDEPASDSRPASGNGSVSGSSPATGTTTPSATPTVTPGNGNSATAPGAANRPDRTTDTAPGNSGTAPGATRSGDRRGGPKADTTAP